MPGMKQEAGTGRDTGTNCLVRHTQAWGVWTWGVLSSFSRWKSEDALASAMERLGMDGTEFGIRFDQPSVRKKQRQLESNQEPVDTPIADFAGWKNYSV